MVSDVFVKIFISIKEGQMYLDLTNINVYVQCTVLKEKKFMTIFFAKEKVHYNE